MKTTKFKTNIKCSGCVAKVSPFLNETLGEHAWQVDLNDPQRTLTVGGDTDESLVIRALEKAGYRGEKI